MPTATCPRCPHAEHIGLCGREYDMQGVLQECICVMAVASTLDLPHLRQQAALHEQQFQQMRRAEFMERRLLTNAGPMASVGANTLMPHQCGWCGADRPHHFGWGEHMHQRHGFTEPDPTELCMDSCGGRKAPPPRREQRPAARPPAAAAKPEPEPTEAELMDWWDNSPHTNTEEPLPHDH